MSETETNLATLRRAYAAFVAADVPGILATFAPDASFESIGPRELLPFLGRWDGHQGLIGFFTAIATTMQVLDFGPDEFIASGDTVVVTGHEHLRLLTTGKEVTSRWVHVFQFRDGLIIQGTEWANTAALVAAHRA